MGGMERGGPELNVMLLFVDFFCFGINFYEFIWFRLQKKNLTSLTMTLFEKLERFQYETIVVAILPPTSSSSFL